MRILRCGLLLYLCVHVSLCFSASVGSHSLHFFQSLWSLISQSLVRVLYLHNFIILHLYLFYSIMCVLSTCSLTCHTCTYPDVVLQFSGFDRQCAQCISLLYPVRYLTIFVWESSLMRETEVIVSSQCNKSKAKFMCRGGNREVCNTLLSMYQVPFLYSHTQDWEGPIPNLMRYCNGPPTCKYELLCKYNG